MFQIILLRHLFICTLFPQTRINLDWRKIDNLRRQRSLSMGARYPGPVPFWLSVHELEFRWTEPETFIGQHRWRRGLHRDVPGWRLERPGLQYVPVICMQAVDRLSMHAEWSNKSLSAFSTKHIKYCFILIPLFAQWIWREPQWHVSNQQGSNHR